MKNINISNAILILGFFDGIHLGHREVINSAVKYAKSKNLKTVLLTFPKSPAEFFGNNAEYIYNRANNYEILKQLGVDFIHETEFSELVNMTAYEYLNKIVSEYAPVAIFSGFNYSFGAERKGSPEFIKEYQSEFHYQYFCIEPFSDNDKVVSSTYIKTLLKSGNIEIANCLLCKPFSLESTVIKGSQIGREIGFPTANLLYPKDIVRIPHGVYRTRVFGKLSVLNWGVKPTLNNGKEPVLEVHIPNFEGDLYGRDLNVEILEKLRDEKKFDSLEELRNQIQKDINECLK